MHYTTFAGLQGIISSGCLWATDAAYLNDTSEITHFFDVRLKRLVAGPVRDVSVKNLKAKTLSMNRPFVLSLCGTTNPLVAESGLLSQWRGYGNDGGFAIVFDTAGIKDAFELEAKQHHYMHAQFGRVYYEEMEPTPTDFKECEEIVRMTIAGRRCGRFYRAVTHLSCFCKHWAFSEEREVRVVVVPANQEAIAADPANGRLQKTIEHFTRKNDKDDKIQVPYVELFTHKEPRLPKLPIKRIIVSPHNVSDEQIEEVKGLLSEYGYNKMAVQKSKIPYRGFRKPAQLARAG
jgi:Protein of unknown function (DUF2971)